MQHLERNLPRDLAIVGTATAAVLAFGTFQHLVVLGVPVDLGRLLVPTTVGASFGAILAQLVHLRAAQARLTATLAEREAEVRDLNRGLEALVDQRTAALQAAHARLAEAEKMDALGRLAGGVAHDMNNVLTAILASAELAREETPAVARYTDEIEAACERGARLSGQLLATARGQANAPVHLDLAAELARQSPFLRRAVGPDVDLHVHATGALPVFMDQGHLEQVLQNLSLNARDAMEGRGALRIEGEADGDTVRLRIADTGPGVPADIRAHIFEPFYTTKAPGTGTGLGLSVTHGIITQAGGTIRVAETDAGCTFEIRLPRATPGG